MLRSGDIGDRRDRARDGGAMWRAGSHRAGAGDGQPSVKMIEALIRHVCGIAAACIGDEAVGR